MLCLPSAQINTNKLSQPLFMFSPQALCDSDLLKKCPESYSGPWLVPDLTLTRKTLWSCAWSCARTSARALSAGNRKGKKRKRPWKSVANYYILTHSWAINQNSELCQDSASQRTATRCIMGRWVHTVDGWIDRYFLEDEKKDGQIGSRAADEQSWQIQGNCPLPPN